MGVLVVIVLLVGMAVLGALGYILYTVLVPDAAPLAGAGAGDGTGSNGTMMQNASLASGSVITAADGGTLENLANGMLALKDKSGSLLWSTGVTDGVARTLTLDGTGRLVLTAPTKTTYVNAPGAAGAYYLKALNGTLGVYNSADDTVHEMIFPISGDPNNLPMNTTLQSNQELGSSGGYVLRNQPDGNLVLIAPGNKPVWASNTDSLPKTVFVSGTGTLIVRGGATGDKVFGADGPNTNDYILVLSGTGNLSVMKNDGVTSQNIIYAGS